MSYKKQDLREHSVNELSLLVFNDESLYVLRRNRTYLLETLNELFIYTSDQLKELETNLDTDEKENEDE